MEEQIIDSIKILLGIQLDDFNFDSELIMHINSVLTILNQLGVGPKEGYKVISTDNTWSSLFNDQVNLELVKSYIYLRVRLLFDPPQNSFLVNAISDQIKEFEWRLKIQSEAYFLTEEFLNNIETEEIQ